jgi:hypothetical protein
MSDQRDSNPPASASSADHDLNISPSDGASRRQFLKSSAGLVAGGTAAQALPQMLPGRALAQDAGPTDGELARLLLQCRILLKGGVVLTLDRLDVSDRGRPPKPWRWEIHVAGKSKPVLQSDFFETMSEATRSGKAALAEFRARHAV